MEGEEPERDEEGRLKMPYSIHLAIIRGNSKQHLADHPLAKARAYALEKWNQMQLLDTIVDATIEQAQAAGTAEPIVGPR